MKNLASIRLSVNGSTSAMRRNTYLAVTRIAEAVCSVQTIDLKPEDSSLDDLLASLVEQQTDCVLAPGDGLRQAPPDGIFAVAVLPRQSARMCLVATPGIVNPTLSNPLGLDPNASVAVSTAGQRAQLLALRPDLDVSELILRAGTLTDAIRKRTFDAVLMSAHETCTSEQEDVSLISLRPEIVLPPPCSGLTEIFARKGCPLGDILAHLDDTDSRHCLTAERALFEAHGWSGDLSCLATVEIGETVRIQATLAHEASEPRSALTRVGAVAASPEAAAELCCVAMSECMKSVSAKGPHL